MPPIWWSPGPCLAQERATIAPIHKPHLAFGRQVLNRDVGRCKGRSISSHQPVAQNPSRKYSDIHTRISATAKAVNENVTQSAATTIHGYPNPGILQHTGEPRAGELAALIGIHNGGILPRTRALRSPFTIRTTLYTGKRATVIGWNRFGDEVYFVLARPNASPFQVPIGMTEPEAAAMTVRTLPRIDVAALRNLRRL